MSGGSSGDKTEKPTPKRKKEARREGRVAKSQELLAWTSVLAGSYLVRSTAHSGAELSRRLMTHMGYAISQADIGLGMRLLGEGLTGYLITTAPLMLGLMGIGIVGNLAQTGWAGSTKKLKPDFKKVNPFTGIKRFFSAATYWEAGKSAMKVGILGILAYRTMIGVMPKLLDAGQLRINAVIGVVANEAMVYIRHVAMLGLVLAAADYAYQRHKISKSMKMTKQEVKEEARQSDGDPHVKGQIRARQRKMSRLRMMAEVATADAVVVNPTHVAVAIKYDPARGAPRVVAKGADAVATKIREEAEKHSIPMVEDIPLARTLYKVCELGDEIPANLYEAVARLLAFIFSLRAKGILRPVGGGAHRPPAPLLQVAADASR